MKENSKKFYKKKSFWAIAAVVIVVAAIVSRCAAAGRQMAQAQQAMAAAGTSAEVTRSSISSAVNGSGSLSVAENTEIKAPTGIKVKEVLVKVGDKVSEGEILAKLDSLSIIQSLTQIEDNIKSIDDQLKSGDLSSLKKKELKLSKEELVEYRKQLNALLDNPVIVSAVSGVVDALYLEEGSNITKTVTSGSSGSSSASGSSLGSVSYGDLSGLSNMSANLTNSDVRMVKLSETSGESDTSASEDSVKQISDFSRFQIVTPKIGEVPQSVIEETETYAGQITWTPADETFQEKTMYEATAVLVAKDGFTFAGLVLNDLPEGWSYQVDETGKALKITAVYPEMTAEKDPAEDPGKGGTETPGEDPGKTPEVDPGTTPGTNPGQNQDPSGQNPGAQNSSDPTQNMPGVDPSALAGMNPDLSAYTSSLGSFGGADFSSASGVTGSLTGSSGGYYSNYETAVCVIRRLENVKVTISVDEQDILSVKKGQKATITMDAIKDRTFEGTITDIADKATTGSGTAKYAVEITIPMDEDMLLGMSASAKIEVANAENVLTIPVLALQQSGNETFVYTQRNDDGTLEGAKTVKTGVSNGEIVEITEGLSEGDVVYYTRTGDSGNNSFGAGGPFGGGSSTDSAEERNGGNE